MTDLRSDAILLDLRSQALCLADALASGSDSALLHAFEAVARARGLSQLAADANLSRVSLTKMVDGAANAGRQRTQADHCQLGRAVGGGCSRHGP